MWNIIQFERLSFSIRCEKWFEFFYYTSVFQFLISPIDGILLSQTVILLKIFFKFIYAIYIFYIYIFYIGKLFYVLKNLKLKNQNILTSTIKYETQCNSNDVIFFSDRCKKWFYHFEGLSRFAPALEMVAPMYRKEGLSFSNSTVLILCLLSDFIIKI